MDQPDPIILTRSCGARIAATPGASLLDHLRLQGIPHAAVCGGKARCTTCRVKITEGLERLEPPNGLEAQALARMNAPKDVRLACQLRPLGHLGFVPLLPADATMDDGASAGGLDGRESDVVVMFVDLRGSTALAETRLPFDVLFILNRFFVEMNHALAATGGHYSNFTGDGLMALYGLEGIDPAQAARQALAGASRMLAGLARLNRDLASELGQPLRMGIGIHAGLALVGTMGPPGALLTSAIGDTVNIAARLEGLSKEFGCALVVSAELARRAGRGLPPASLRRATIRGRQDALDVHALDEVAD
jgi:adenylate cyclase